MLQTTNNPIHQSYCIYSSHSKLIWELQFAERLGIAIGSKKAYKMVWGNDSRMLQSIDLTAISSFVVELIYCPFRTLEWYQRKYDNNTNNNTNNNLDFLNTDIWKRITQRTSELSCFNVQCICNAVYLLAQTYLISDNNHDHCDNFRRFLHFYWQ